MRQRVLAKYPDAQTYFIDYPAIPVNVLDPNYLPHYRDSIAKGINALTGFLNSFATRCSGSAVVLAGYSQGAHVAGDVYQGLGKAAQDMVVGLTLLGDPRFNPDQAVIDVGPYDPHRVGVWQARGPGTVRTIPAARTNAVRSYCLAGDPVCNYSFADAVACAPISRLYCSHLHYADAGFTNRAGDWLNDRIASAGWSQEGLTAAHTGFNTNDSTITTGNAGKLKRAWQYAGSAGWIFSRPVVWRDEVVFSAFDPATSTSQLNAVSFKTGVLLWQKQLNGWGCHPLTDGTRVLIQTDQGLFAYNLADGSAAWSQTSLTGGGCSVGSGALDGRTAYVLTSTSVAKVDSFSGTVLWRNDLPVYMVSGLAVWANGVYAVTRLVPNYPAAQQGRLYTLNATTGNLVWSKTTAVTMDGTPAVADGLVYVGTQYASQGMLAFDTGNGAIRWQRKDVSQFWQTPAVTPNAVLVTNNSGTTTAVIRALNPRTGATLWQKTTPMPSAGGDPVVANGVVYFGTGINGSLVNAVRLDNGATVATLQLASGSTNFEISPAVVNGTVLSTLNTDLGTRQPSLQAFRLP
ncbi:Outer membrane protein assembly factor BamB, contains PQQ-like beta-propeller repeat [Amycolatopsis pretoriensis]|uniref:Outer membrane protein assembly factor BamB, contains PQQ-like beta-propeller repeat n=1 Tax=Amycolatopsis pretoriensis TaxID=218821 RepID=A0A1H5QML1_9PSEU|nr:Outer membrane protein assembly factor BamB, contains PQQ-like beta-propeller repeat [Amycolatopsis pretoriensis]